MEELRPEDFEEELISRPRWQVWGARIAVVFAIAAALLVVIIVLCIVKREKLVEALRAYRSEMKKITWFSWKNVVRCTVFVLVSVVAIAAVVGLLDFVFRYDGRYALYVCADPVYGDLSAGGSAAEKDH